ncbi:MAG: VCBS repeat-containing protein, partial [Deltaproteobacteria bacterium]|nr:VCBS repeat-containing protein [Deltaproteobacteria bacterium]
MHRIFGTIALAFVVLAAGPRRAAAAEFLVHDGVFTLDEAGAHAHGFYWFDLAGTEPADWQAPDDYYHGEFHVRVEALSQATSRTSQLQYCIWQDSGARETCSSFLRLDGPGSVATAHSSPADWWILAEPVDFSRPGDFSHQGTPLRDETGCIISDWGTDFCWDGRADYLPYTARMTVVAVSAGSTFSGWERYVEEVAGEGRFPFTHHFIADSLQLGGGDGRFGSNALADFDRDGDLDFAVGNGSWEDHALWWFENRGRDTWVRHDVGPLTRAFTSGLAHDIDGDGWLDLVTSHFWFRNPQTPATSAWTRHQYSAEDVEG